MKKISLAWWGFINSLATLIYVALVALVIINGDKIFGEMEGVLGPIAFLMLFVFSALITSLLILGRPVYLSTEGQKKEALKLLFITIGWMLVFLILVFGALILV